VVQHEEFAKAPYAALQKLHAELEKLGVQGLQMPAESRVSALLKPSTAASPFYLASERAVRRAAVSSSCPPITRHLQRPPSPPLRSDRPSGTATRATLAPPW